MSRTTKSATQFARHALEVGKRALPDHSSPFSPRKFTQPQLFAMLQVKQFLKLDYRGLVARLAEWAELRAALELKGVPHDTTLVKADQRFGLKHDA